MILKFNRKGERFPVYNEQGELKYNVKITTEYSFYAEIFDDLFVSQLADIKLTEKGYLISAFDSPVGLMQKGENGYNSDNGEIILKDLAERGYSVEVLGDKARIVTSGSSVAMQSENESSAILLIGLGLMLLAEQEKQRINSFIDESESQNKQKSNISLKQLFDAFFVEVGKIALSGGKALWEKRKLHGKTATAFLCAIILSAVLFVGGIVGASVNTNKAAKYKKTVATVYVLNKKAVARFSVQGYYYKVDVKPKYKTGYTTDVYYTLNKNGEVDKCTFNKPNATPFIIVSAISVATAVTLSLLLFLGLPKLPKKTADEEYTVDELQNRIL